MKGVAQTKTEKELSAVSNLLIIKEHEKDLKAAGIWEPLQKVPPEQLEQRLADLQLQQQDRESRVTTITEITSTAFETNGEPDEGLEDILKAMSAIKEGSLEPETAKEQTIKKELE